MAPPMRHEPERLRIAPDSRLLRDDAHRQAAQHDADGRDPRIGQDLAQLQGIAMQDLQPGKAPCQRAAQFGVAFDHDELVDRATRFR